MYCTYYSSPIGIIEVTADEKNIVSVYFLESMPENVQQTGTSPVLTECIRQLDEYFKGQRKTFELPLDPQGTAFQQEVWQHLQDIPYGRTVAYNDIAHRMGNEGAVRAVGAANGSNPISVIIPCHRVIGADGRLTGYGGGLWRKEWLLKHEGALLF